MSNSEYEKKIDKIFQVLEKAAFELISLNTHFYREKLLVIASQYVNKQSQDFRYYSERIFRIEVLSD